MRKGLSVLMLGALAAVCSLGTAAKANTIQSILTSVTPIGGGLSNYTYSVQLTPNNSLVNAPAANQSALAIVDFDSASAVSFSQSGGDITTVADWSGITTPTDGAGFITGLTWNSGVLSLVGNNTGTETDSSSLQNVLVKYLGSGVSASSSQQFLIHMTITANSSFAGTDVDSLSRNMVGTKAQVDSFPVSTTAVPVPAAAWAGLSMLGGLGLFGAARRRRTA